MEAAQREQAELMDDLQQLRHQRGRLGRELRGVLQAHERLLDEYTLEEQPEDAGADTDGPTIHRRPRTQLPVEVGEEDIEQAQGVDELAGPTQRVDAAEQETLMGMASLEQAPSGGVTGPP